MKRTMAMTTLWIATAAVVAGGTTTALATSGGSPGAKVLTQSDVRAELAKNPQPTSPALPDTRGALGVHVVPRALTRAQYSGGEWTVDSVAGTVYLRCGGNRVTDFRAVAKPEYQVRIEQAVIFSPTVGKSPRKPGEAGVVATFFKSGHKPVTRSEESESIRMLALTCVDGKPVESLPYPAPR
ncbi:hypothetical protein EV138_1290 [Kribbella voronezhensis]|uniref:Secreted protein n=1 Tax=Kribbella voronezhensis TaxID=2512212 RepID=A0A4R7T771_9ACTN|nr:hypothetical protein [Kribbella voronezhensis]TDU87762.1 hypothetical protein EV138_1290 [Kribbella voronezhensis]